MPLLEHLKELKTRVFRAAVFVLLGSLAGWFLWQGWTDSYWKVPAFRGGVFGLLQSPILEEAARRDMVVSINFGEVGSAFDFAVKGALWIGVIVSSPFWLWQFWRFITPGLTKKERGYAVGFISAAVPLFFVGAFMAYLVLPNAVRFLIDFTPADASNVISASVYIQFCMQIILAFGLGFLVPVVIVALNLAGVVSGKAVLKQWRLSVFISFLFAAIATPTTDITTMFMLVAPLLFLFFAATVIALINDKRRARKSDEPDYAQLSDDEASTI
ncbi:twin-arginine translocase subunit TatC [Kineococcus sp. SYSU DK002]|uniref:twin-arginine translocase subunit TatC n=1 Tax=Kineococcus sp. SYSU DK002 TaxID=3383123 RepID=UPI003D7D424B